MAPSARALASAFSDPALAGPAPAPMPVVKPQSVFLVTLSYCGLGWPPGEQGRASSADVRIAGVDVFRGVVSKTAEDGVSGETVYEGVLQRTSETGAREVRVRINVMSAKNGGGARIAANAGGWTFEVGPALSGDLSPGSYAAQSRESGAAWAFDVLPFERPDATSSSSS